MIVLDVPLSSRTINRLGRNVTSFAAGVKQLATTYRADEYELAYNELMRSWQLRTSGST